MKEGRPEGLLDQRSNPRAGRIGMALALFALGVAFGRVSKKGGDSEMVRQIEPQAMAPGSVDPEPSTSASVRVPLEAPPPTQAESAESSSAKIDEAPSEAIPSHWPPEMRENLTVEEIAALSPDELYALNHARRPSYLAGAKGAISDRLEDLSNALDSGKPIPAIQASVSVMKKSIILTLAEQGREEYLESGEPVNFRPSSRDSVMVVHNCWMYNVDRSEFPEFFEAKELQAKWQSHRGAKGAEPREIPQYLLNAVHEYAANGLSCFPDIPALD